MIKLDYLRRRFPIVRSIPTVFESCLTVEEQVYCIYNYIQDVLLPAHNTNASAIEEIQEVLDTLQPYVNNKLDEMLENGQFQEFIESEVFQDFNTRLGTVETNIENIPERVTGLETNLTTLSSDVDDLSDDVVENTQNINLNSLAIQELENKFIVLTDTFTDLTVGNVDDVRFDYPDGLDKDNCVVVAIGREVGGDMYYGEKIKPSESSTYTLGISSLGATLGEYQIAVNYYLATSVASMKVRIVLLKIDEESE